jgi:hypothetical protein
LLGRHDQALADYEQTIALDPTRTKAAEKRDALREAAISWYVPGP